MWQIHIFLHLCYVQIKLVAVTKGIAWHYMYFIVEVHKAIQASMSRVIDQHQRYIYRPPLPPFACCFEILGAPAGAAERAG
jgi:hypothetical protein